MQEEQIANIALENLKKNANITGKWQPIGQKELDGKTELTVDKQRLVFNTEIKTELRNHQLPQIYNKATQFEPLLVIAKRIFPAIKEELRQKQIAYLETNGNIYLKRDGITLWIENNKPLQVEKEKGNRAFTKTGLRVLFQFLLNEQNINLPYREMAAQTEVGLGNINYVMNGLLEAGFLVKLTKGTYKMQNKKALFEKWMTAYEERLKPDLKIGTFRFLKEEDFLNWKHLPLKNDKTWWGGEPAGDLFTNYLRPAELTLYTLETRNELIKNYRLVPDENGNVKAYKKFWKYDAVRDNIVPPLLVYTDLMNTQDRRCMETAQKIYDELLQNKL